MAPTGRAGTSQQWLLATQLAGWWRTELRPAGLGLPVCVPHKEGPVSRETGPGIQYLMFSCLDRAPRHP